MRNRFDRLLADPRSIAASVAHILAFKEAQDNAAAPTEPCLLLRVPPEIRTIIWENVLRGGKYNPLLIETITPRN
jgi:hypothetical protein